MQVLHCYSLQILNSGFVCFGVEIMQGIKDLFSLVCLSKLFYVKFVLNVIIVLLLGLLEIFETITLTSTCIIITNLSIFLLICDFKYIILGNPMGINWYFLYFTVCLALSFILSSRKTRILKLVR